MTFELKADRCSYYRCSAWKGRPKAADWLILDAYGEHVGFACHNHVGFMMNQGEHYEYRCQRVSERRNENQRRKRRKIQKWQRVLKRDNE